MKTANTFTAISDHNIILMFWTSKSFNFYNAMKWKSLEILDVCLIAAVIGNNIITRKIEILKKNKVTSKIVMIVNVSLWW